MSRYVDGPAVVVNGREALIIEKLAGLNDLRIEIRGRDPELDQTLAALHRAALAYTEQQVASDRGTCPGTWEEPASYSESMTASSIAHTLGITTRAVRRAATTGRLTGRFEGGQWRFAADDVALWIARRRRP